MAIYAIGDIQGCYRTLLALLEKINFDPSRDTLLCIGDLVNRGPQSLETLRLLISFDKSVQCILGNHDLHCLAVYHEQSKFKRSDTLTTLLQADDCDELMAWLLMQPLVRDYPELHCLLVHAGIPPGWDLATTLKCANEVHHYLAEADFKTRKYFFKHIYGNKPNKWHEKLTDIARLRYIVNALTRIRFCNTKGHLQLKEKGGLSMQTSDLIPWFSHPKHIAIDRKILFGHWASLNGYCPVANMVALDTGCVWGGVLTAYDLEKDLYIQVDSQEN